MAIIKVLKGRANPEVPCSKGPFAGRPTAAPRAWSVCQRKLQSHESRGTRRADHTTIRDIDDFSGLYSK